MNEFGKSGAAMARRTLGFMASIMGLSLLTGCVIPVTTSPQVNPPVNTAMAKPPAIAPAQPVFQRAAITGARQTIVYYYWVNPDCTPQTPPSMRIVQAPEHGTISFEHVETYPSFAKDNQRYECNKKKTASVAVVYQSAAGYVGDDTVKIEAVYQNGTFKNEAFSIAVN